MIIARDAVLHRDISFFAHAPGHRTGTSPRSRTNEMGWTRPIGRRQRLRRVSARVDRSHRGIDLGGTSTTTKIAAPFNLDPTCLAISSSHWHLHPHRRHHHHQRGHPHTRHVRPVAAVMLRWRNPPSCTTAEHWARGYLAMSRTGPHVGRVKTLPQVPSGVARWMASTRPSVRLAIP